MRVRWRCVWFRPEREPPIEWMDREMSDLTGNPLPQAAVSGDAAKPSIAAELSPYTPRWFVPLEPWQSSGFDVKPYWISVEDREPDPELLNAAHDRVAEAAREAGKLGDHHDASFFILHHGTDGTWLLFYWWVFGSIFGTFRFHADDVTPFRFDPVEDPRLNACVWEGVVVEYERQAWVRTMLTSTPDHEAYLKDRLKRGRY